MKKEEFILNCEYLANCPFLNDRMKGLEEVSELFKRYYCHHDSSQCACHMIAKELGMEYIPMDLAPYKIGRANQLISFARVGNKE
jgi:hypothetical protein